MRPVPPSECQKCFPNIKEMTAGAMGSCTYEYAHQPDCPNAPRPRRRSLVLVDAAGSPEAPLPTTTPEPH